VNLLKSQLSSWLENPVAQTLHTALTRELENLYKERAEIFLPGKASKTHEIRSNILGQEAVIKDILDILVLEPSALNRYFDLNGIHIVDEETEIEE
jgi:hypothetical protein